MYAVINDRSKQYTVRAGDTITIDSRRDLKPGAEIVFDRVLSVGGDSGKTTVGTPTVSGARVIGKVEKVDQKGKKIYVVKWRRREQYQRRIGHRQKYTVVKITDIQV